MNTKIMTIATPGARPSLRAFDALISQASSDRIATGALTRPRDFGAVFGSAAGGAPVTLCEASL